MIEWQFASGSLFGVTL